MFAGIDRNRKGLFRCGIDILEQFLDRPFKLWVTSGRNILRVVHNHHIGNAGLQLHIAPVVEAEPAAVRHADLSRIKHLLRIGGYDRALRRNSHDLPAL